VKAFIWGLCSLPFLAIIILAALYGPLSPEFLSWNIAITGYSGAVLLAICLILPPLHKIFPSIKLFTTLKRYQKQIGLSVFYYALIHGASFFINRKISTGSYDWIYFFHPVIIPGVGALLILLVLSLTSNTYSKKKLTYKKWKNLHRFVYLAEAGVFLHMIFQGGKILLWGCAIFIPLMICQFFRRRSISGDPNGKGL
jgi:sulfoxide reductase heme-binding subunit YedZ